MSIITNFALPEEGGDFDTEGTMVSEDFGSREIITLEEFNERFGIDFVVASGMEWDEEELSNLHLHWDPVTEFYNTCHLPEGPGGGRFCSGPDSQARLGGRLRDPDGVGRRIAPDADIPRGPRQSSLIDPNEGTKEFDGLRGYDDKGKPVPGSDAWLEAHNIAPDIFKNRPYVKFEPVPNEPAIVEAYKEFPHAQGFFLKKVTDENQNGGYIMIKNPAPGSPHGIVSPQIRPNEGIITDPGNRARKEGLVRRAKETLASYQELKDTGNYKGFISEREQEVKAAELNLKRIQKATPEKIREAAEKDLDLAKAASAAARKSGDPVKIAEAKKELTKARRDYNNEVKKANNFDQEIELWNANRRVEGAKNRLEAAKKDPEAALDLAIRQTQRSVERKEKAFKKTASKYTFAPRTEASRIDVHQDPQNIKNLTQGKGRIYFAMEGAIKNDAILTAIRKEDPTAAVVNVPSVTLWQGKGGTEGEVAWFAKKYGKGREIVLVPDADGVVNPAVTSQANALAGSLRIFGADNVLVAFPPVKPGTKRVVEKFNLPSGVSEERKGVDDHLGAGRGSLGQLQYQGATKTPSYELKHLAKAEGGKVNKNAVQNLEKSLAAISAIAGPEGSAQMSKKMIASAGDLKVTSAYDSTRKLKELGIVDIEFVFDPTSLSRRRRVRHPDMTDTRLDELVRRKIIKEPNFDEPYTDISLDEAPIITIKDPKYIIKASDIETGVLADRPNWNPPKNYKGWTSAVTGKTGTLGNSKIGGSENTRRVSLETKKKQVSISKGKVRRLQTSDRTIRTAAGAAYYSKLYGIPLKPGDPIPILQASALTSLQYIPESEEALLEYYSYLEQEAVEFYNKCHNPEDGRFCETEGGEGAARREVEAPSPKNWPEESGREVKQISRSLLGRKTVDGVPSRYVYEVATKNGGKLRLYDVDGVVKEADAKSMLNAQAKMHELYPMRPAKNIIATNSKHLSRLTGVDETRTLALTFPEIAANGNLSRYTFVNSIRINKDIKGDANSGYIMKSAGRGNTKDGTYNVIHEYGHHVDFARHYNSGKVSPIRSYSDRNLRKNLSRYGNESRIEAYAEAFADWHYTNGQTRNPATIALAEDENWYRANALRASASSEGDNLGEYMSNDHGHSLLSFQTEESNDKESEDLTDEEFEAFLKTLKVKDRTKIVGIRDTDHGPEVIGNIEEEEGQD